MRSYYRLAGVILILSVLSLPVFGGNSFLGIDRTRIETILDLGYNLDEEIDREIATLRMDFPGSPVPDLLEAGKLYWYQNYAQWDQAATKAFEDQVEKSIEVADEFADEYPDDLDAQFVLASSYLFKVIYLVDKEKYFAAFWSQRKPMKLLKRILENDPEYSDAKMPIGLANCYLSKTPGYLKPLALLMRFKGNMGLGMAYLNDAKERGLFSRADAAYYLAAVQIELHENNEAAHEEYLYLAEKYPDNPRFQISLASLERKTENFDAAYNRMKALYGSPILERFDICKMHVLSHLFWSSLESKRFEQALETSEIALNLIESDERYEGWRPWTLIANAEALYSLGRHADAVAVLRMVPESNKPAFEHAKRKIEEIEHV